MILFTEISIRYPFSQLNSCLLVVLEVRDYDGSRLEGLMFKTIAEIRRKNLRKLVSDYEGMNKLASQIGLSKGAYISQMLMDPPVRPFTEKTARKWEEKLGLSVGWFDEQHDRDSPSIDTHLLAQVLEAVDSVMRKAKVVLSPAKIAELVAMQYADSVPTGRVELKRIKSIVDLLKH